MLDKSELRCLFSGFQVQYWPLHSAPLPWHIPPPFAPQCMLFSAARNGFFLSCKTVFCDLMLCWQDFVSGSGDHILWF